MTKRFEYTDIDGVLKEAEAYIASEFVTTTSPNSPIKTLPSGLIDPSLLPPVSMAKASTLVIDRIAEGAILRGDLVRAFSPGRVTVADPTSNRESAEVLGLALNDAADTENVEVLILGIITDSLFSVFAVNEVLFLDDAGGITNVRPTKPSKNYLVNVGKALGSNEIFVNVQQPITLS